LFRAFDPSSVAPPHFPKSSIETAIYQADSDDQSVRTERRTKPNDEQHASTVRSEW
jgi:hypothetical protein